MNSSIDETDCRQLLRFTNVRRLLEGALAPTRAHPSLILCTIKKGASSYVGHVLQQLACACELAPVDLGGYVHELPPLDKLDERALEMHRACSRGLPLAEPARSTGEHLLRAVAAGCGLLPKVRWPAAIQSRIEARKVARALARFFDVPGCMYGPIRGPRFLHHLPRLDRRKVVFLLRDPRDVLTSLYFSVSISHQAPRNPHLQEAFQNRRQKSLTQGIDGFVREQAPQLLAVYQQYCLLLQANPNFLLLRYEDMVANFGTFLDRVIDYWGLSVDAELRNRFLALADFEVQGEDVQSHKRQVKPGDHRRKLSPETINWLSEQFFAVLDQLGYGPAGEIWTLEAPTLLPFEAPQQSASANRLVLPRRRAA